MYPVKEWFLRAVIQRVSRMGAVEDEEMRPINAGLVVLIGVGKDDDQSVMPVI